MKKLLKIILWTLTGLVLAVLLLPFLFKQKLIVGITNAINDQINAELSIEDAHLSFIKSFPLVNINIENLKLNNIDNFSGTTLFAAHEIDLSTDLVSIFNQSEGIKIINIDMQDPSLTLKVDEKGKTNWDILRSTDDDDQKEIYGDIEKYSLSHGQLKFDNRQTDFSLKLDGITHEGKGNFRDIVFDLITTTEIEKVNLTYENIPYLIDGIIRGDMNLLVDLDQNKYTFKDNLLNINDLALSFVGDMLILEEAYLFDISFNAPNNKVSNLFSLIPNAYTQSYDQVTSQGHASLTGRIKGRYDTEKGTYPSFVTHAIMQDGRIKYDGFKYPIEDINLDFTIQSKEGNWHDLSIDFSRLDFSLDKEQIVGKLKARNVLSDPDYNGLLNGKMNLNTLSKAFPLPQYEDLKGIVKADIFIKTDQKSINEKKYANIEFNGNIDIEDFAYIYNDDFPISLAAAKIKLDPKKIEAEYTDLKLSQSHLEGRLKIKEPLSLLTSTDTKIEIDNTVTSEMINLDELKLMTDTKPKSDNDSLIVVTPASYNFDRFITLLDITCKKVIYQDYNLSDIAFSGSYNNDTLSISNAAASINGNKLKARANFYNLLGYINDVRSLEGSLFIESPDLDFNSLYQSSTNESGSDSLLIIPDDIALNIYPDISKLSYGGYQFKNFNAKLQIADGVASIIDGKARIFDGNINLEGSYDSSSKNQPQFNFKYSLSDLAIAKMFEGSRMFRLLAPAAEYVDGLFNSTLILSGPMKDNMMPDLYKISASGIFETVSGKITGFKPLQDLANKLGLDELKNWEIKDSKNWFDINEGTVYLKETDYNFQDMEFKVAGKHSLDQSIDYILKAKIPREKLRKSQLIKQLDNGYEYILAQAKKRGVQIDQGDYIFLDIYITETIKNPKFRIIPVGSGGQSLQDRVEEEIKNEIEKVKEEAKNKVAEKTKEVKDSLTQVAENKKDEIVNKVEKEVDKQLEKVKEGIEKEVKVKADSLIKNTVSDTLKSKVEEELKDIIGKNSQAEIDSIKAKLKDWNPFKKKKADKKN